MGSVLLDFCIFYASIYLGDVRESGMAKYGIGGPTPLDEVPFPDNTVLPSCDSCVLISLISLSWQID